MKSDALETQFSSIKWLAAQGNRNWISSATYIWTHWRLL